MIIGDFNPNSTGLSPAETKRYTGLTQIVNVLTRDTGILDCCLTNKPNLFNSPKQLPKLGSSCKVEPGPPPSVRRETWDRRGIGVLELSSGCEGSLVANYRANLVFTLVAAAKWVKKNKKLFGRREKK